jgi:cob(I)alamin adenosyltransferase
MMKIYTKSGDKGQTSLFGGTRINKDHIQIEAYGTVDELNSFIGMLLSHLNEVSYAALLKSTQALLFDIGSHLASDGKADEYLPSLKKESTLVLEKAIDDMTEQLPELKSFIMPGGNERIGLCHVCRTICRRAERRVVSLQELKPVDTFIVIYLNRLSDFFFVLARFLALQDGIDEIKWNPKS